MHKNFKDKGLTEDKVIEECSELIKEIIKAKTFGLHNYHPRDRRKLPNGSRILRECDDVLHYIHKLKEQLTRKGYSKKGLRDGNRRDSERFDGRSTDRNFNR